MQLTVKDKKRIEAKFRQARAEFKRLVEETRALNEQIRRLGQDNLRRGRKVGGRGAAGGERCEKRSKNSSEKIPAGAGSATDGIVHCPCMAALIGVSLFREPMVCNPLRTRNSGAKLPGGVNGQSRTY